MVQGYPVHVKQARLVLAGYPISDRGFAQLSVSELSALLSQHKEAIEDLNERMRLADEHISMIARLYLEIDTDLSKLLDGVARHEEEYRQCLRNSRHPQMTALLNPQKWFVVQGLKTKIPQRQQQKEHLTMLFKTCREIYDKMTEDLGKEQLAFDEGLKPVIRLLEINGNTSCHS
jgi:hypothetical protein